jgi:hypothetical protein
VKTVLGDSSAIRLHSTNKEKQERGAFLKNVIQMNMAKQQSTQQKNTHIEKQEKHETTKERREKKKKKKKKKAEKSSDIERAHLLRSLKSRPQNLKN